MAFSGLTNRTIWITGASTGIGREIAEALIGANNRLIVTARSFDGLASLQKLDPANIFIVTADIGSSASTAAMSSELTGIVNHIDTIILNAGICEYVDTDSFDSQLIDRVNQVNFIGLARCVEAALPLLRNSDRDPHIVGISSAAAITGLPRAEAYGASKAAVVSFLESLALDLAADKIDVSIVYPGFVDTPLTRRENDFPMPFLMDSKTATRHILKGIDKRKHKIAFPLPLILSLKLMRLLPDALRHWLGVKMVRD